MQSRFLDKFSKVALCATMLATVNAPLWAAERTTPVEVKNTPAVTVTNTPNVAVTNVPVVSVTGTPNVAVTNVPNVSVTNVPTVNIGPNNVVQAITKSNTIRLWATDQIVANGTGISAPVFDCNGYKEVRVILKSNSSSASLTAWLGFGTSFNSGYMSLGVANFAKPTLPVTGLGNFQPWNTSTMCYFSHPVISNSGLIVISNASGASVTISKDSWVYLVN